ncbi:hypothetical protein [Hymenobacter terrenus]|uniref:hypothetical protein n=1 Tax=Hymenobacter terrenus TaxID=1629124 RepID=UPI0006197638|nr:hypothetical protein [Hymenobacter terrenus]
MIENFLSNPFRNLVLGQKRTLKYADVHLERLQARLSELPVAPFTDRAAATRAAVASYREHVQTGAAQDADRQSKTLTNDEAIARFQRFVSQQAKVLAALFTNLDTQVQGEDTDAYKQFFPRGVMAITKANKAALDTEAAVFLRAAAAQQVQVGPALLIQAQQRWQQVEDSRKNQLATMGSEQQTKDQRQEARTVLADTLFLNLLTLLTHFHLTPERVRDFFPEAILKEYTGPATPVPPTAA